MATPTRPSAAIQIVRPDASATTIVKGSTSSGSPVAGEKDRRKGETNQRLCRNVLIYGACRFQDQGCVYYHPPPGVDPNSPTAQPQTLAPPSLTTPTMKDNKALNTELGAEHLSAPVFVPKTPMVEGAASQVGTPAANADREPWPSLSGGDGLMGDTGMQQTLSHGGYDGSSYPLGMGGSNMDGSMYMAPPTRQTLDYHLYTAPLPHITTSNVKSHPLNAFFISDDLRRSLTSKNEATFATPSAPNGLPAELGVYHNLVHLGSATSTGSKVYGHPAPIYRATSTVDGNVYALRRIEGYKLVNEAAFGTIDTWRRMKHPNIVTLREAFTTKAFNDNSLILVYDFHPESATVWEEHMGAAAEQTAPNAPPKRRQGMPIPERQLWSYITQIANALKAIHSSGLAARNLDPSKIIITGKNRIRLNGCGVLDVLVYDANHQVPIFQQEDLVSFGKLVISMACEFFQPGQHPGAPLDHIARHYSPDVKNLVLYLISKPQPGKTIDDVIRMIGPRILNELDAMQNYTDVLESDLSAELENGRIVRLLTKLGFINERAEFELDPRWSDTGDRYILKLFRDFVFHSVSVDGTPILDLSHVITCLNKLDAGLDERIMLVSRDDQSCLVVSYREIKSCIEAAYNELKNASGHRGMMHR